MKRRDVAVIVPTYNRAAVLAQALDSLLSQTRKPAQLIVVDDGSTDTTAELVARYGSAVEYVKQPNAGKPSAINAALDKVTASYLWVFDDDDTACVDAIERYAEALDSHPACGYSFGTYVTTRPTDLESGVMGEPCGESVVPELAQDAPFLALLENCYLSGATFFVRTDLLKSVDGYDPRFQRSEDYDLAIRFARRWSGVRVKGGPTFVVRNHSGLRGDATDRFPMSENLAKFYEYDALLFDELFSTLDPAEYLPPGLDPSRCQRQIDLQKLSLAVMHRVNVRMDEFLVRLALAPDAGPYSASERAVMDRLIERIPSLWTPSGIELVSGVRKHSSAPSMRRLRREILRALVKHHQERRPSLKTLAGVTSRALGLFLPIDR